MFIQPAGLKKRVAGIVRRKGLLSLFATLLGINQIVGWQEPFSFWDDGVKKSVRNAFYFVPQA